MNYPSGSVFLQCVPLATEPGISLIIVTPLKILQWNLNMSTFVVWEMKRNVSVVRFKFRCNILVIGKIIKEMPGSVASGTQCMFRGNPWQKLLPSGTELFICRTAYLLRITMMRSRERSVGIATRYGLEGPGIESRWETRFSAPVQTGRGAHPVSYKMDTGSLSRG